MNNARNISLADFLSLKFSAGGHPLTQIISQPLGAVFAWLAYRSRLSANQVTLVAVVITAIAAACYLLLPAGITSALLCLALLQSGYALDCADGQLARAIKSSSSLGAWLDVYCDYLAILFISFALLLHLQITGEPLSSIAALAVLLFTIGRITSLYSSSMARAQAKQLNIAPQSERSGIKQALTLLMDHPLLLLMLCLLRDQPELLTVYLICISPLYIAHGIYVGKKSSQLAN